MIKSLIQKFAHSLGYRIVPWDRDYATLYRRIEALPIQHVIDVGAAVGNTVVEWHKTFPNAHIHALEPRPDALKMLNQIAARYAPQVSVLEYAASDFSGQIDFFLQPDHPTASSVLKATDSSAEHLPFDPTSKKVTVEARPLDSLIPAESLGEGRTTLLKMDVQGAEHQVLGGATETLKKCAAVFTEIGLISLYEGQCNFDRLIQIMLDAGFEFAGVVEQFHLKDGTALYLDALFLPSEAS